MGKEFEILKDRPKIKLKLTRDSVCAGDDMNAPHEKKVSQPSFTDPFNFINNISSGYLPTVAGRGHTWDCLLNGNIYGTISINDVKIKINEVQYEDENHVHFKYNSAKY